ncbi:MAG: SRPBCC family protein [Crocinitomicaceae bacterium]|nr:SRPBCC family protein [Crocinitomicaceae bacterium]
MQIDRSILIDKKPEEVYSLLSDFHHWKPWSPWLILEPEVAVHVREDGKFYEWSGDLVGSGEMTIIDQKENSSIDYDLTFLKPWKSKSKVGFIIAPDDNGSKVTWTMESKLPWFMFWMKKMMSAFIGMDYKRGLLLLKDFAEDGEVHSKLEFKGINQLDGCKYIGIKRSVSMEDMGESHKADFTQLMTYAREKGLVDGNGFTIYNKWDLTNGICDYTACVPVKEIPSDLPASFVSGERPKTKAHTVKHIGPYHHIGNAWSAQMNRQRSKRFKANKKIHPIEVYLNSPLDTPPNQLETEIHIAVN